MKSKDYLELKEKVNHGDFQLPMNIYVGEFRNFFALYLHWHDEMEFIYIKQGKGTLYLDLEFYDIHEGDFILIKKDSLHYVIGDKISILKYEAVVFDLDMLKNPLFDYCQLEFIEPMIKNELHLAPIIKKCNNGYEVIMDYYNKIVKSYLKKEFGYQLEIKGLLFLLFFQIFNNKYAERINADSLNKNKKLDIIKKLIQYIKAHYNEPITVKELANIAEYSEYHFIRFFKAQTGKTCTQFINSVRLEEAARLLVTTKLSITEIAYEVGFGDVSYFIKIFKKQFSDSPSNYRKK